MHITTRDNTARNNHTIARTVTAGAFGAAAGGAIAYGLQQRAIDKKNAADAKAALEAMQPIRTAIKKHLKTAKDFCVKHGTRAFKATKDFCVKQGTKVLDMAKSSLKTIGESGKISKMGIAKSAGIGAAILGSLQLVKCLAEKATAKKAE